MFVFAFATYLVPIVLLVIGFRRAALWLAALITMVLVFAFCSSLGLLFHFLAGGSEGLKNFKLYFAASEHIDQSHYSMLSMIVLLPWAFVYDLFITSLSAGTQTKSVWVFIWQGFGVFINLLIWGLAASTVRDMTFTMSMRK